MARQTIYQVVTWSTGDKRVTVYGPGSEQRHLLTSTLCEAERFRQHATIVPWHLHAASPAEVLRHVAKERAEREEIDAACDAAEEL